MKNNARKKRTCLRGKLERVIIPVLFFTLSLFFCSKEGKAASAFLSIQAKDSHVTVGENVYVTIVVRSAEAIKGFEGYFSYDNRYLKFVTGGSRVHGNDDRFRVLDVERASSSATLRYTVKFQARKSGVTSIQLKKPYNILADDENGSKMSVSYQPYSIEIEENGETAKEAQTEEAKTEETKKSSNKLESVELEGVELAPAFDKDIKKYSGIITTGEDALTIRYQAVDSDAKVKIKGNKNLKDGKNEIRIIVTSTDGKKRVYRFSITVDKKEEKDDAGTDGLTIVQKGEKTYLSGDILLEVLPLEEAPYAPEGYVETVLESGEQKIKGLVAEDDKDSEYVLVYGRTTKKEYYVYDKKTKAVFSYEEGKAWYEKNAGKAENEKLEQMERKVESYRYMFGIVAAFSAFLVLLFFMLFRRHRF